MMFCLEEEQSGPKSHLEVLAEMRDYRRRRQSYRAKNVHITKKSYTEVCDYLLTNKTLFMSQVTMSGISLGCL